MLKQLFVFAAPTVLSMLRAPLRCVEMFRRLISRCWLLSQSRSRYFLRQRRNTRDGSVASSPDLAGTVVELEAPSGPAVFCDSRPSTWSGSGRIVQ